MSIQNILDCRGSSSPLYLRLLLSVYDQSHDKDAFLKDCATNAYDFPSMYEIVLQQWKILLLSDLQEALTGKIPPQTMPSSVPTNKIHPPDEHEDMTMTHHTDLDRRALLARHALSLLTVSRFGLSEKDVHHLLEDAAPRPVRCVLFSLLQPHLMAVHHHRRDNSSSDGPLYHIAHNQLRLMVRYETTST